MQISEADRALLWSRGKLKFLLKPNQRAVYDAFQTWNEEAIAARASGQKLPGKFPRLFVFDCSRRYGKDFISLLVLLEKALVRKNGNYIYAAAHQKEISEIANMLLPQILETCPPHLKPVYRDSYRGQPQGIYFNNGSVIKLVGLDLNPDGLRGKHMDGAVFSETGFIHEVVKTIESVLEPHMMGRNHAFMLANSTPPEAGAHDWDTELCPDARARGAYILKTIWDSHYPEWEKREFLKIQEDGTILDRQRREFLCERIRESTKVVVPEFLKKTHVREFVVPKYAQGYVAIDPAVKDLCAVNFGVWDFENHRLLIQDEWTERNANTDSIVQVLKAKELELWNKDNPLRYWDGKGISVNPFLRMSDVDAGGQRMITDFIQIHGIQCMGVDKLGAEAALHALRNAFQQGHIWIHPRCVNTIEHLEGAVWNKGRTSYERSKRLGHADHVDVLKYLWRHINKQTNPFPPETWVRVNRAIDPKAMHYDKARMKRTDDLATKLGSLFPSRWGKPR